MTKIFLIRHGQSDWNAMERIDGQKDESKLSELGKKQAHQLAERLSGERINRIYSSPLRRAKETAKIIGQGKEIIFDDRLKERDFGELGGLFIHEIAKEFPLHFKEWKAENHYPGKVVESFEELEKRSRAAIEDIAAKEEGTIAVVWHGTIMRSFLGPLLGIDSRDERVRSKNCSLTTLTVNEGAFTVEKLHDTSHLEDLT